MATPTCYSPPALARLLGVAEETVYRWLRSGKVPPPSIAFGATRAFDADQVETIRRWYESRKSETRANQAQS